MLQSIREGAKGWLATLIIGLLIIPFAFWGITSYFDGGAEPSVAQVNGIEITQRDFQERYQQTYRQQQQSIGADFTPDMINEDELKAAVIENMIAEVNLQNWVASQGFDVDDAMIVDQIRSSLFFQEEGVFSQNRYAQILGMMGQTQLGYEAIVRENLRIGQATNGVLDTAVTASDEVARLYRLEKQTRDVQTATLIVGNIAQTVEVTEGEIQAYYDENQDSFYSEERVQVQYLQVTPEEVAGKVELDEAVIRVEYDENKARFSEPETRRASHILLTTAAMSADEAQAKLADVKAKVAAGESFFDFAVELSEDPGSAIKGGDLGWVSRGRMVPAFDAALFEMAAAGTVSDIVETQYGYHLIQLDEIKAETVKPFEDVRAQIEAELAETQATTLMIEIGKQLQDLTYDNPETLEIAATELGLTVETSDWFSRDAGTGVAQDEAVRSASFDGSVLNDNDNSDVVELPSGALVVVRKNAYEPSELQSLEAVASRITVALQLEKARELAIAKSLAVSARLALGQTLAKATEPSGASLSSIYVVGRNGTELPAEAMEAAFSLPRPSADKPSYSVVELPSGDQLVVVVTAVSDGKTEAAFETEGAELRARIARTRGNAEAAAMLRELRLAADVKIWTDRL